MANKLIVISIDSLQTTDLHYLRNLPSFGRILGKCALVKNIREVYPTLTYPIHTTIITGVHPDTHGITHNQQPSVTQENLDWSIMGTNWNWYSDYVKVPSLMDAANEKNLVTASVMWPVMGGQKPKHNLAEIWPNSHESMEDTFRRACTPDVYQAYFEKYLLPFDWEHRTDMDGYSIPIAADIIRRYNPDFMLIHSICLDHCRHEFGDEGIEINQCLDRVDGIVGTLLQAAEEIGTADRTNFVILGDHGQINIQGVFNLNVILKEKGFINTDEQGNVTEYRAYSFSAGFSTHIILSDAEDEELKEQVYFALLEIKKEYGNYMGRIFNSSEAAREEGLSGGFTFVVESVDGIIFDNQVNGEAVAKAKKGRALYRGMHGHHPSKGPKPPFLAFGPDIKAGTVIESGDMLDECPTLARLLNLTLSGMEGKYFDIFME